MWCIGAMGGQEGKETNLLSWKDPSPVLYWEGQAVPEVPHGTVRSMLLF